MTECAEEIAEIPEMYENLAGPKDTGEADRSSGALLRQMECWAFRILCTSNWSEKMLKCTLVKTMNG